MKIFLFMILFLFNYIHSGADQSTMIVPISDRETVAEQDQADDAHTDIESTHHTTVRVNQGSPASHTATMPERDRVVVNVPVTMQVLNRPLMQTANTFSPHNYVHATSESNATTISKHWQQLNNYVAPIKHELSSLQKRWYQLFNRWPYYASGGTYGSLFYFLVTSNHAMNSSRAWSQWKKHLSIQELQQQPQSILAHDLLTEIQTRYVNKINPTDTITPLARFMTQLEHEQTCIARYLQITSWLSWLWLKKIFPFNSKKIEQAQHAQQRLNFINHIFISWATTHNINELSPQFDCTKKCI